MMTQRFKQRFSIKEWHLLIAPLILCLFAWKYKGFAHAQPLPVTVLQGNVMCQVNSIGFSHDGKYLVSGSGHWGDNSGEVIVWDVKRGQIGRVLPSKYVSSVIFSKQDRTVIVGGQKWVTGGNSRDGLLSVWDPLAARKLPGSLISGHSINSMVVSKNGNHLYTAGSEGTVRKWDAHTERPQGVIVRLQGSIRYLDISNNGKILGGASGHEVVVWDIDTGKILKKFSESTDRINAISFSAHNEIAGGGFDNCIRVWDIRTGKLMHVFDDESARFVTSLKFSHDGKTLAAAYYGRAIKLWDINSGNSSVISAGGIGGSIKDLKFSPDNATLASADGSTVKLWPVPKSVD